MVTVTGHLLNPDSTVPQNATVTFQLICPKGDVPRISGAEDVMPIELVTVNVDPTYGSFSVELYGNDALTPYNTFYRVTFNAGNQRWQADYYFIGASADLSTIIPLGGVGSTPIPPTPPVVHTSQAISVMAPSSGSLSFPVAHALGVIPVGAIVMMTSLGEIAFQKPTKFDKNNLYLMASDYSDVSADIYIWS